MNFLIDLDIFHEFGFSLDPLPSLAVALVSATIGGLLNGQNKNRLQAYS